MAAQGIWRQRLRSGGRVSRGWPSAGRVSELWPPCAFTGGSQNRLVHTGSSAMRRTCRDSRRLRLLRRCRPDCHPRAGNRPHASGLTPHRCRCRQSQRHRRHQRHRARTNRHRLRPSGFLGLDGALTTPPESAIASNFAAYQATRFETQTHDTFYRMDERRERLVGGRTYARNRSKYRKPFRAIESDRGRGIR